MSAIPLIDISFGRGRGQKWRPLRALIHGLGDGATVDIRLPEEKNIMQKCRCMLAAIPVSGPTRWTFDLRVHVRPNNPNVLRVTKVYLDGPQ